LHGAAVLHRINALRAQGVEFSNAIDQVRPDMGDRTDEPLELVRESA
jgi:hypothetical protein